MQHTALIISMATVYITRFKSNAMADTAAGVPYLSMKISAAGWPPVADGVIAEKNMSEAEKIMPFPAGKPCPKNRQVHCRPSPSK